MVDGSTRMGGVVFEQGVNDAQHLERQGHDRLLVSLADGQRPKLVLPGAAAAGLRLSKIAEHRRTQALPLRVLPLLRLPALVRLPGQEADPRGEPFGAAKHGHVGANFHQQHRRTDAFGARQVLEQHQ